ncbi:MAG: hypothetical protein IPI35_20575 [Deltaproteobacteria bacterium]|nr:hypothetical protein [Deltaproteobacteria bacterium]
MPEREELEILHLHVEHTRGAHPQRLDHAEPSFAVVHVVQAEDVDFNVRVEAGGLHDVAATLQVELVELLAGLAAREGGVRLPAGEAEGKPSRCCLTSLRLSLP